MNILALDAAGAACSCAVWSGGRLAARTFEAMARGQSERLVPMANEVMAIAGLEYQELDAVAVTLGPGGFTGVRIGLATARAFALALSRPIVGITSFQAVASGVLPAECAGRTVAVVLEAKRADLYVQAFAVRGAPSADGLLPGRLEALSAPAALLPEELNDYLPAGPLVLIGDAVDKAAASLAVAERPVLKSRGSGFADAALVAALAAQGPLPAVNGPAPAPLYLRAPDVTLPGGRPFGARPGAVGTGPDS
jgi:tRNA threonylcarbamoyladenosine biosynthesis protein TsaB